MSNIMTIAIAFALLFASLAEPRAYGGQLSSPWSGLIQATAGQKPEYFDEEGQYLEISARALYHFPNTHSVGIIQGVKTVKRLSAPNKQGTWANDTLVRYNMPLLHQFAGMPITIGARIQSAVLANSETSRRDTLRGSLGTRVNAQSTLGDWTFSYGLEYTHREYRLTRNPDGRANYHTQLVNALSVIYTVFEQVTVNPHYTHYHRIYHHGTPTDLYWLGLEMSYRWPTSITFNIGLDTTDSQLKNGRRAPVYFYKEDLTEVYVRLDYSL